MIGSVSLRGLRAFEAVARLGSFKVAAQELNLTPSAVSHAVIALERSLGVTLIDRRNRDGRLTDRGENFYRHVRSAFDQLQQGIEEAAPSAPRLLRVHSAPSFAAAWLSPRLPRFLAQHPGVEVRLSAGTDYSHFSNDDCDVDIVYGSVRASQVEVQPIAVERVAPMCAPEVARRIRTADDLLKQRLIQSDNKTVRWSHWFDANGIRSPKPQGIHFDRSSLAIAAAVDGLGIALESTLLAERELSSGRLVMPLLNISNDIEYVGHHLVYPKRTPTNKLVTILATWMSAEIAEAGPLMLTTASAGQGDGRDSAIE